MSASQFLTLISSNRSSSSPAPGPSPILELTISGRHANQFIVAQSGFPFLQNYLEGKWDACDRFARRCTELGTHEIRSFGQWGVTGFYPQNYPNFYGGLRDCASFLEDRNQRLALDVFTSCQDPGALPARDCQRHLDRCVQALQNRPGARLRLGNEYEKNGYNPADFTRPAAGRLIVGNGSRLGDTPPPINPWTTFDIHPARNGDDRIPLWVKSTKAIHESYEGDFGQTWIHDHPEYAGYRYLTAGEASEPIAMGESSEPGRTASSPFWFWQMTGLLKMAGGFSICAHWRQPHDPKALELPGPNTSACIEAMVQAAHLPLGLCQEGTWRHTNPSQTTSIYATDRFIEGSADNPEGTMDSYELQQGSRVEHIGLVAGPAFNPNRTQNGAQLLERYQYRDETPTILILSR
jgi:hypothetical protein